MAGKMCVSVVSVEERYVWVVLAVQSIVRRPSQGFVVGMAEVATATRISILWRCRLLRRFVSVLGGLVVRTERPVWKEGNAPIVTWYCRNSRDYGDVAER
jgi:hypothetical protein